jgi:hypothetical protein
MSVPPVVAVVLDVIEPVRCEGSFSIIEGRQRALPRVVARSRRVVSGHAAKITVLEPVAVALECHHAEVVDYAVNHGSGHHRAEIRPAQLGLTALPMVPSSNVS